MKGNGTISRQDGFGKQRSNRREAKISKCKGTILVKNLSGKKVKKQCGNVLDENAIFCSTCGTATNALKESLSGSKTWKSVWQQRVNLFKANFPSSLIFALIPGLAILWALTLGKDSYWMVNLVMLFIAPLAMLPIGRRDLTVKPEAGELGGLWKLYPSYWLFTLLTILFFLLMKILCTGFLLGIVTDPLLHIARLIVVLHWLSIMMPAPRLIAEKKVNAFNALIMCYKASAETRWQQFYLIFVAGLINLAGVALLGVGVLFTAPLAQSMITEYYKRLDSFKLFE